MVASRAMRALFAGRFQPFHSGHLAAILAIFGMADEVIVGVCAPELNLTLENPFTCGERMEMIGRSLDREMRARTWIAPLPSLATNSVWGTYVQQYVPYFQYAFTNNALQAEVFAGTEIEVRPVEWLDRPRHQGSVIRVQLGTRDSRWRGAVPPGTERALDEIDAEGRLYRLAARG